MPKLKLIRSKWCAEMHSLQRMAGSKWRRTVSYTEFCSLFPWSFAVAPKYPLHYYIISIWSLYEAKALFIRNLNYFCSFYLYCIVLALHGLTPLHCKDDCVKIAQIEQQTHLLKFKHLTMANNGKNECKLFESLWTTDCYFNILWLSTVGREELMTILPTHPFGFVYHGAWHKLFHPTLK